MTQSAAPAAQPTPAQATPADPWRHVLRPEDLSLSLALQETAEGVAGLPYSPDAVWPLEQSQIELLAFEQLLLCRPADGNGQAEDEQATLLQHCPPPGTDGPQRILRYG